MHQHAMVDFAAIENLLLSQGESDHVSCIIKMIIYLSFKSWAAALTKLTP